MSLRIKQFLIISRSAQREIDHLQLRRRRLWIGSTVAEIENFGDVLLAFAWHFMAPTSGWANSMEKS